MKQLLTLGFLLLLGCTLQAPTADGRPPHRVRHQQPHQLAATQLRADRPKAPRRISLALRRFRVRAHHPAAGWLAAN